MNIAITLIAVFVLGMIIPSAYAETICSPYYDFATDKYYSKGPTMNILHFNPIANGYEFPSTYHTGERYLLNVAIPNDNYCKKTTTLDQEYENYKLNPNNYTISKYNDVKFSFIVQISKLGSVAPTITFLDDFSGVAKPGSEKTHSFVWIPQEEGHYLVQHFLLYDKNNPIPLAPKTTKYIEVLEEKKYQTKTVMTAIELFKYGMALQQSNDAKQLVVAIKASNGMPVSVTSETKEKLVERGWARAA